jgi:hypothetical protein
MTARKQNRELSIVATAAPVAVVASLLGAACLSCFVAGTLVSTPDGPRPIESLRVGDLVWSYALAEGRPIARPLIAIHHALVREARRVELDDGRVIQGVTPEHPVFSPKTGLYLPVSRLSEGDTVATYRDGDEHALATVARVVATEVPTPTIQVFNLSVGGDDQNYFADGVLVHNKSPECTVDTCTSRDSAAPDSSAPDSASPDSSAPDSASPDSSAPDSASLDSSAPDSGPEGGASCGAAAMGQAVSIFPSGGSLAGGTLTYEGCSGSFTLGATPAWNLMVAAVPSFFRLQVPGFRTSYSAEMNPIVFSVPAPIPLQAVGSAQLAGYDVTKAHVVVSIGSASGACEKSGNTVSLPGHPEAVVTYVNSDGTDSASTSTQQNGLVWIRGITPGAPVKPAFVSGVAGCAPNLAFSTGNVKLAADSVSVLNVEMKP